MSREFLWQYTIPTKDHAQDWEQFFAEFGDAGLTVKSVPGGGGNEERSWIHLWGNKTKVCRIADILDDRFDGVGDLAQVHVCNDPDCTD